MTIDEYQQEANNDLKADYLHFNDSLLSIAIKIEKWSRYQFNESEVSIEMAAKEREIYKRRYKYYLYDDPLKIEKKNIDIWVQGDEEYRNYMVEYKKQLAKEEYIAKIISSLSQQSFIYQTALKNEMFRAGAH